jgi:D-alanyl-D-alanine carboxypeptidase
VLVFVGWKAWTGASALVDSGDDGTGTVVAGGTESPVSPLPTVSASPARAAPPACAKGNQRADAATPDDWAATLLDTTFRIPTSYALDDLVPVTDAGFDNEPQLLIRSLVVPDLAELRQAAADAGNPIDIVAAYRSVAEQKDLFDRRVQDLGQEEAEAKTARPGHSEHQLGTAIDFRSFGDLDVSQKWDTTPTGQWMLKNAWKYGFVQSYPKAKTDVTCYAYEPWHYRYFGRALAKAIHDSGLTVREYLWDQLHPTG